MKTHKFTPPMRQGVTASQVYLPPHSTCLTVYDYLCQVFPHIQATEWRQRFDDQLIFSQTGESLHWQTPFQSYANQHLYYYRFLAYEPEVPFQHHILFENEQLLVIDKPHFLTVSPTGQYVQQTLLVRLKDQYQLPDLTPIHRLDRETAGIILFSKQKQSRGLYQQLFATHQIQKIYHAIAPYHLDLSFPQTVRLRLEKGNPFYTMTITQGEPNSETWIDLLEIDSSELWAKYQLRPKTGKQHQLRVHLNALGLPIRHDPFYPVLSHKAEDDFSQPLQLLAKELHFIDPVSKHHMHFCSTYELSL